MISAQSGIVTPEAVILDFQTAGIGSRALARLIDVALQIVVLVAVSSALALIGGLTGSTGATVAFVVGAVLTFVVVVGYSIILETWWNGLTIGKAIMGLRVITREGAPIRFRHAAVRELIALIEVYALGFIAVISAVLNRSNQRVGDMAGGTIVVRERASGGESTTVSYPPPPGLDSYVRSLDVTSVTEEQYRIIRSFLLRVLKLRPAIRASLAVRLANPVAVGMRHQPPPGLGAEVFLVCVASAYQVRHGGSGPVWSAPGWPGYGLPPGWGFPPGFNGLMPAPPAPAWGAPPSGWAGPAPSGWAGPAPSGWAGPVVAGGGGGPAPAPPPAAPAPSAPLSEVQRWGPPPPGTPPQG